MQRLDHLPKRGDLVPDAAHFHHVLLVPLVVVLAVLVEEFVTPRLRFLQPANGASRSPSERLIS